MRFRLFIALLALLIPSAQAAHFVVSPGESIQAAIDNASPGDVIEVESGVYRENVDVNKPLTLRGLGMPTIDAGGKGSAITLWADGITIEGFVAANSSERWYDAGITVFSNKNIIKGNNAVDNNKGIHLCSSNNIIEGNNASDNKDAGIQLQMSTNNTIEGNNVFNNKNGMDILDSDNNTIVENNVYDNEDGIKISYSSNNIMRNNQMSGNRNNFRPSVPSGPNDIDKSNLMDGKPVYYLSGAFDAVIDSSSNASSIYCIDCKNITVRGLTIKDEMYGIYFENTSNSRIENNNVSSSSYGIDLWSSDNNTIKGNNAYDNNNGIYLFSSCNNIMRDNQMSGNTYNFIASGHNDIDTSNLVDGKPVYYLVAAFDTVVDLSSNAGAVYCIDCENVTVSGLTIKNNKYGVFFDNTNGSRIVDNYISASFFGIFLDKSDNNIIEGNKVVANDLIGIELVSSSNNIIEGNNASYNEYIGIALRASNSNIVKGNSAIDNDDYGIKVEVSSNNTIEDNNATYNDYGIKFDSSTSNIIEGNNVSDNTIDGIILEESSNNTMRDNLMSGNLYNFGSDGYNDIDTSNFVDGKPVYYLVVIHPATTTSKKTMPAATDMASFSFHPAPTPSS